MEKELKRPPFTLVSYLTLKYPMGQVITPILPTCWED